MTLNNIRAKYLSFFKARGHAIIPSASLVPQNDPTTLFTGSGMQPMVPYLLGKDHPKGARIADSQKAFRTGDIEEIGDNRHTTLFEMLGNWSLGDYFKQEQLTWFFEFLTDPEEGVGLDPSKLYVTVFLGDEKNQLPRDTEAVTIWKELFARYDIDAKDVILGSEAHGYEVGMQGGRIFYYDAKKNWWSRAGVPENMPQGEPGGPDSEVFYDFGTPHDPKWGEHCHPNCDCGRFVEIGNSVFMQYLKKDGGFELLPKQNVDFGGGLERITMAASGVPDVIMACHRPILDHLESVSGKTYGADPVDTRAFRVVADHLKASVFLIADGVLPSNADQGYFVRRLLRRAVRYVDMLGVGAGELARMVPIVVKMYAEAYPEIASQEDAIRDAIQKEEERFRLTLARGLKEFERIISLPGRERPREGSQSSPQDISGHDAFILFSTYGFPLEMTMELASERGARVDEVEFKKEMEAHQQESRAGSEQKFKGGLADTSAETTKLHTAHHLLLRALQLVLGPEVKQKGSNITAERLRIDFISPAKMTPEQIAEAERIVNEQIAADLPVVRSELAREDAEKIGAEHEFGAKYPDRVTVYSVGPKGATVEHPQFAQSFSLEFCGGPHVEHTGALGEGGKKFKILKEEAVSAGVRRIKAVLQ